jgi:predicted RNase H-like HicB family nuclease
VTTSGCTIVIERLPSGAFRASAPAWPDCTATSTTEAQARQAVEEAIEHLQARIMQKQAGERETSAAR